MIADDIELWIEPSMVLGHGMKLRVTPGYQDQLIEIVKAEEDASASLAIELSAGQDLVNVAVQLLEDKSFDVLLSSVLWAFLRKNKGKQVKFKNGTLKAASGFSREEIDEIARDAGERQVELERRWAEQDEDHSDTE